MPVTIRDVAQRAGVGVGTVSRVMNNSPLVSEATRRRVLEAVADLQYVPNLAARRLSLGKTLMIAVIVPFFTRPSVVERLRGVESTVAESEYDLIVYNVETPERRDACFRNVLQREKVDGVLIVSLAPRDDDVALLNNAAVPVVLVDAYHPRLSSVTQVYVDDVYGGCIATQYLIELGHRRIGFIGDPLVSPFNFTSSRDRFHGYRQALDAAVLPFNPAYHGRGEHSLAEARRLAERMLAQREPPTAIFAASDTQAIGVIEAARNAGKRVPEDLSVIGYDDIEVAEYLGLTTIRQPLYESGKRGVDLLFDRLFNRAAEAVCERLPVELVVRRTTAPPCQ